MLIVFALRKSALIRFGVEALVQMRNNRHGEASLVITGSVKHRIGEAQRTIA
jgi:hypothetical protein